MRWMSRLGALVTILALAGCSGGTSSPTTGNSSSGASPSSPGSGASAAASPIAGSGPCDGRIDGHQTITAWYHGSTTSAADVPRAEMAQLDDEFNQSQPSDTVNLGVHPPADYSTTRNA